LGKKTGAYNLLSLGKAFLAFPAELKLLSFSSMTASAEPAFGCRVPNSFKENLAIVWSCRIIKQSLSIELVDL
jgi:hypothetical protein